jgi:hypothetical protein
MGEPFASRSAIVSGDFSLDDFLSDFLNRRISKVRMFIRWLEGGVMEDEGGWTVSTG